MKKILYIITTFNFLIAVDYESEIQPIFNNHCGNCHLGNSSGNLNLSNYDNLMSSDVVIPGDHISSILYDRITRDNSDAGDMPPGNSELTQSDIDLIALWIDEGALVEANDISGCMDSNALNCNDGNIDPLYFPECSTCSDGLICDNYYNPEATIDNGLCMYSDVPSEDEFIITETDTGFDLDWSSFVPPVDIVEYVLQRCLDPDGDSDGDGELEYENCTMIISPGTLYLETTYSDDINSEDGYSKYTLYVHYSNNNYWGSAQGYYYFDNNSCSLGDITGDGLLNVLDIVNLVNYIFGMGDFTDEQLCAADLNEDSIINVLDIVNLVNLILS